MSDHRRLRARSPVSNPARMSAPIISAGTPTVNYGRSADLHSSLHAIPTRREHFVSPRSSGNSIETATHYKIKPERDSLAPPKTHGRSRRNTVDASSQPIIVTPTSRYNVVVGEPSSARASRDTDIHDYREEAYVQPASSSHRHRDRAYSGYRGSSRTQHTIDNADISERHPHDREAPQDRLLRVGSARDGQMYPRARPITNDTLVRHPDTVKDDYGDNGYGYTNPKDLVEYDLESTNHRSSGGVPQRRQSRRESWDNSRGGRPASIGGFSDLQRPYESRADRERGPPPSTRGFERILGDRNSGIYHMPPSVHMPMPHDHIGSPLTQAPSSAYPAENLGVPQRRTSTRRPVSVYNDDRDRDRRERDRMSRDEYDVVDGRPRGGNTFAHEDVSSRGFGIRPDLMPPANVVNVQPPAAIDNRPVDRVERVEREDERLSPRNREEKRYHDSDERRYHVSERDPRRDDRDRERSERRPEPRSEHEDRDRKIGTGIAAGSIAAAAMGVGAASAARDSARESRNSDEDREREHARRGRRESDQYYNERPRRNTVRDDEPPVVDLTGRDPIERTSPREDRAPRELREREREYRDERAHDSDSRRERDRDSDNGRREPAREPRRESPLQSEKVDLSDRYPVIERNVAKEDMHYPSDTSRSSPPISRRDRDRDYESDNRGSRRDRVYDETTIGRETISSPLAMNDKEARDLRALREDMGLDRAIDDSPPPPRPPKEPIEASRTSAPAVGFSRQSTDQISDRPLDPPSRQVTMEDERSFVPPALTGEYSSGTQAPTTGTTSSRDSLPPRPRFSGQDRGYSSASTSSTSSGDSGVATPRERSCERTTNSNRQSVQVVSPPRSPSSSQATLPVKGILKPPRVFPELPAEERPGVAPLIDKKTGKNWDGREMADVPPSARWTKISRKLVNPEALEKGKERYEVRDDFVVVLRVLTKDEIQGYAVITQNIRAQREDEEREERRRRRGGDTEVEDTERDDRRRRRRDDDETEEERAERKRKERERDERRRKYDDEETSEEREERKAKEREERHRTRREERYRSEPREDETADQAEERRRRERAERRERHERRRRERESRGGRDDDEDRERRRRRARERRERDEESDTTEDDRDDREERRRRRRERERD